MRLFYTLDRRLQSAAERKGATERQAVTSGGGYDGYSRFPVFERILPKFTTVNIGYGVKVLKSPGASAARNGAAPFGNPR
jgi:hypothetical protein